MLLSERPLGETPRAQQRRPPERSEAERRVRASTATPRSLPGRSRAGWGPRASRRSGGCFQAQDSGRQLRSAGNKTRTDMVGWSWRGDRDRLRKLPVLSCRTAPSHRRHLRSPRNRSPCPRHRMLGEDGCAKPRDNCGLIYSFTQALGLVNPPRSLIQRSTPGRTVLRLFKCFSYPTSPSTLASSVLPSERAFLTSPPYQGFVMNL